MDEVSDLPEAADFLSDFLDDEYYVEALEDIFGDDVYEWDRYTA